MGKTFKYAVNIIISVMVALVVIAALCLFCMGFFGMHVYSVVSGSMEPNINVGSLIVVKETEFSSLEEQDVITYVLSNGVPCTHRIVSIDSQKQCVITKGDANDVEDAPVYAGNIVGKVVVNIPLLGYVMYFVQNPPGMYIVIAIAALIVALTFIPDIFMQKNNKKQNDNNNSAEN